MNETSYPDLILGHVNKLYSQLSNHYSTLALLYEFASGDRKLKSATYTKFGRHPNHSDQRLQKTVSELKTKIATLEKEAQFFNNTYLG